MVKILTQLRGEEKGHILWCRLKVRIVLEVMSMAGKVFGITRTTIIVDMENDNMLLNLEPNQ